METEYNGSKYIDVPVPKTHNDRLKLCYIMYCIGKRNRINAEIHMIDDISFSTKHRCHNTKVKECLKEIDEFYQSLYDIEDGPSIMVDPDKKPDASNA